MCGSVGVVFYDEVIVVMKCLGFRLIFEWRFKRWFIEVIIIFNVNEVLSVYFEVDFILFFMLFLWDIGKKIFFKKYIFEVSFFFLRNGLFFYF